MLLAECYCRGLLGAVNQSERVKENVEFDDVFLQSTLLLFSHPLHAPSLSFLFF